MNPLVDRIIAVFDQEKEDQVSFRQFVKTLSVFSPNASREDKIAFIFKVYDVQGDGVISLDELEEVLSMLVGSNLQPSIISNIARHTLEQYDLDGDGNISLDDFRIYMQTVPHLEHQMTISF